MKLTQKIIDQADRVIRINNPHDLPFTRMVKMIALAQIKHDRFYSFVMVNEETGEEVKTLVVADYDYSCQQVAA